MTINSASISQGATALSPTGGSALVFAIKSRQNNAIEAYIPADAAATRRTARFQTKAATPDSQAPNGYTQNRNVVVMRFPKALANGNMTFNTLRIELSADIETTDAEKLDMQLIGGQVLADSDFLEYWRAQQLD